MPKPVTSFASANLWLVCPLHGKSNFVVGNPYRLRTPARLRNIDGLLNGRSTSSVWLRVIELDTSPRLVHPLGLRELVEYRDHDVVAIRFSRSKGHPTKSADDVAREESEQGAKIRLCGFGRCRDTGVRAIIWKISALPG